MRFVDITLIFLFTRFALTFLRIYDDCPLTHVCPAMFETTSL